MMHGQKNIKFGNIMSPKQL